MGKHQATENDAKRAIELLEDVFPNASLRTFLGKGGYNQAWEVRLDNDEIIAFRVSNDFEPVRELEKELSLYREMKRKKIGVEFYGGKILERKTVISKKTKRPVEVGILAIGMAKARALTDYIKGEFGLGYPEEMEHYVNQTLQAIRKGADSHYFFGDIKPDNMLVIGTDVFLSDFDPGYSAKNAWIPILCDQLQIRRCSLHRNSYATVRALYARAMIFQMFLFLQRKFIGYPRSKEFADLLYEKGVKQFLTTKHKPIQLGDKYIQPHEVLVHILGDSSHKAYQSVLDHYFRKQKKTSEQVLHSQLFLNFIPNFTDSTPQQRDAKSNQKITDMISKIRWNSLTRSSWDSISKTLRRSQKNPRSPKSYVRLEPNNLPPLRFGRRSNSSRNSSL